MRVKLKRDSLSLKEFVKTLYFITIILSATQCFDLEIFGRSLFQISAIVTIIVGFYYIFYVKRIKKQIYLIYCIIMLLSSVLSWFISSNRLWANSYVLLDILSALLLFLCVNIFDQTEIKQIIKMLIFSQLITIVLSVFVYYRFYIGSGISENMSFFGIGFNIDADTIRRMRAGSQIRLSLPYPSPPQLSYVMAMCIYTLYTIKDLFEKKIRLVLIFIFLVILLFTGSRTGLYALIALFLFNFILSKKKIKRQFIFTIPFILIIIGLFFMNEHNIAYLVKMMNRFKIESIFSDRHFLVPLDGIIIWLSSAKYFFFGIGYGSSINMIGQHTSLPAYFLNSFVTIIVEKGMFGLLLVSILILNAIYTIRNFYLCNNNVIKSVYGCYIITMISFAFYEIQYNYFYLFILPLVFLINERRDKNGKHFHDNSSF
ncbi:MAG: O-antigen ligase family protein [Thomasclavelia sp.]